MHRGGRPVSAKPHSRDIRTTEDNEDTRSVDGGHTLADEHAVAAALQRLAQRQAARQYSAHNTSAHQGHNWDDLFKKMDFNRETDAASHSQDEFVSVGDEFLDPWSRVTGKAPKSAQKSHDRYASANATFETFVNDFSNDHVGWFDNSADQDSISTAGASREEKSIRVDLKRQHNGTQEIQGEEKKADVDVKSPSVSREEYNRHMKLISQKLSEEKLRLQRQLQQYPRLPRPPAARPSPGTRKVVSHKRMIRLAASNPPPVFDVITGMTGLPSDDSL